MIASFLFLAFIVMMLIGVPIGCAMGLAGSAAIALANTETQWFGLMAGPQTFFAGLGKYPLLAIPMFGLVGSIFERSGVALRLVNFAVAIVGRGPTGAVLANLLGVAGLSVLVLEKEAGIHALPRAIHFDGEVMRVFQGIGLRDAVLAIARPGLEGMHFVDAQGETLFVRGGAAALCPHGVYPGRQWGEL